MLNSLRMFEGSAVAQQRLKIIELDERYGEKATKGAFGADRKLIWRWRKRLKDSSGRLSALVPFSTRPQRTKREKSKHPIRPERFGHIVSDTVEVVVDGIKYFCYSAIDAWLKFAFTLLYPQLNSRTMRDFYFRFKRVYPLRVRSWQTDNGSENLGEFDEELRRDGIVQDFSYPCCPKTNAYIERYNRTVQEEFIQNHLDVIHDRPRFNRLLGEYFIFYNTERPHKSLGLKSPMEYLIEKGLMSQMSLTYTAT